MSVYIYLDFVGLWRDLNPFSSTPPRPVSECTCSVVRPHWVRGRGRESEEGEQEGEREWGGRERERGREGWRKRGGDSQI